MYKDLCCVCVCGMSLILIIIGFVIVIIYIFFEFKGKLNGYVVCVFLVNVLIIDCVFEVIKLIIVE